MIKYDLRCAETHTFEVWFSDSNACDKQLSAGEVACPFCGNIEVTKALMAPSISKSDDSDERQKRAMVMAQQIYLMREFREHVEKNGDNVGASFPEEARRIHYGEAEQRNIYGEADLSEAKELIEEGVDVMPIPGPFREDA
jgi:hypothetical protein